MWETGKDKNIPMTSKLLIRRFLALGTREIFLLPSNIANDLVSSIAYDYQFDAFNSFFPLESWTHHWLDGSAHGACPANLQRCSSRGTDNRFAKHVKEQIRERRARAIDWLVPLMK